MAGKKSELAGQRGWLGRLRFEPGRKSVDVDVGELRSSFPSCPPPPPATPQCSLSCRQAAAQLTSRCWQLPPSCPQQSPSCRPAPPGCRSAAPSHRLATAQLTPNSVPVARNGRPAALVAAQLPPSYRQITAQLPPNYRPATAQLPPAQLLPRLPPSHLSYHRSLLQLNQLPNPNASRR